MRKLQLPRERSPRADDRSRRRSRGFSLIELLVVLFIIGIAILIAGLESVKAWKRQQLAAAVLDVRRYLQDVPNWLQKSSSTSPLTATALVTIGPRAAPLDVSHPEYATTPIVMAIPGAVNLPRYTVPPTICLSSVAPDEVQSVLWDSGSTVNDTSSATPRSLACDSFGRALFPSTSKQIAPGPSPAQPGALIVLSHADMVLNRLRPPTRYLVVVGPVWNVTALRQVKLNGVWTNAEGI